jgi:uncharacterized damage-inducible protein DinB
MADQQQLFIKIALSTWDLQVKRAEKIFNDLSDEQLMADIAPGKNSGIYLLGHLVVVHDMILPLFGLGKQLYPDLQKPFLDSRDKSGLPFPTVKELRQYWNDVHNVLTAQFSKMQPDEWFQKHNSVSAEDFMKEPHRNRLNVILNRSNHLSYHMGQVILLAKTNKE